MFLEPQRLADLLAFAREDLDCEIKNWLDLRTSNDDKATFAKAVIALANHGGGFLVFGLTQTSTGFVEAVGRPTTLEAYDQDLLNGIVQNYCDPALHCAVNFVAAPTGLLHPIVVVPGGQRVPIRARRASPDGKTVQNHAMYMRKPGPRSEVPMTSQEWDALLARCLQNRRDEMFDQIRALITGAVPQAPNTPAPDQFEAWMNRSRARWEHLVGRLPADAGTRMPHGRYTLAYEILGDRVAMDLAQLAELLRADRVRYSGWPPFINLNPTELAPYPNDDAIECWICESASAATSRDPAHADFWRISTGGKAFLLRGYQEDGIWDEPGRKRIDPASVFDVTLPVWRVGETLLHAERLATKLSAGPASVRFVAIYEGLAGRELVSLDNRRLILGGHVARQEAITLTTHVELVAIRASLPEIVRELLSPLYALFGFFELPLELVANELARMRSGRF